MYPNLVSNNIGGAVEQSGNGSTMVDSGSNAALSLNTENGTSQHLDQNKRLRQPMAKNSEVNDYNGSSDLVVNSPTAVDPWPIKNKPSTSTTTFPGDTIWNTNSLFDFSIRTPVSSGLDSNTDNGWQSLKGLALTDSPWTRSKTSTTINGFHHQQPPGFEVEQKFCSSCEERKEKAVAHCEDCKEDICETCYQAHLRVKLTKDHRITWLGSRAGSSSGGSTSAALAAPTSATTSPLPTANNLMGAVASGQQQPQLNIPGGDFLVNRGIVQAEVLQVYQGAVEKAKTDSKTLMNKAGIGMTQIEEAQGQIAEMRKRIEHRCTSINSEIVTLSQNYILEIKKRQELLLKRLDLIHRRKIQALDNQSQGLKQAHQSLKEMTEQLSLCSSKGHQMELIKTTNAAMDSLKEIQKQCGTLCVHEDDNVDFNYPDGNLVKSLGSFSFVGGSGYAPFSVADGEGLKKAILGKDARFIVVLKDQLGEQRVAGGDPLKVLVMAPDGRIVRHSIFDGQNGTYRVVWKPNMVGEHHVNITLKDLHIQQSPFRVNVRMGRNYMNINEPIACFGTEGEADGQLCRPWGVCCTKTGLILVANRSNNRIEVFDKTGKFQYKFGKTGKLQGEFERPASVACDNMNRVIVTDKDNHRIQIFTMKGDFLQMFGEKGSKPGQFNYPWDVATNSRDQILVSDTRNHRIQLFSAHGEFLSKYGFEGREWKHFDSPRGVCFTPDDQIVVTDFNNHRLLVVNQELSCAQYLGKEGSENGMFTRPNGVAVDEEGNIIVADSRNDRIQVFNSSGSFISKFGIKGTNPGEFDRPSGICVSPEGAIIVVDFGNNRVQIF